MWDAGQPLIGSGKQRATIFRVWEPQTNNFRGVRSNKESLPRGGEQKGITFRVWEAENFNFQDVGSPEQQLPGCRKQKQQIQAKGDDTTS